MATKQQPRSENEMNYYDNEASRKLSPAICAGILGAISLMAAMPVNLSVFPSPISLEPEVAKAESRESYSVIYADPPWRYDTDPRGRAACVKVENHYPTMTVEEICALKFDIADNAVLYLWATAPKLEQALQVMRAWGFTYKTHLVWDKVHPGIGYWARGQHEMLLVGVKGRFSPPPAKARIASVYTSPRGKHSKKPDGIRDLIASWFPNRRRVELFARQRSEGWDAWGNEV
jgi:N6-adenosine-specific RNA methylase IME4